MTELLLTRIANYLVMNASFLDDLGLYQGKMGCVLFFAHYSRYTDQIRYAEFASELLDEIYTDLCAFSGSTSMTIVTSCKEIDCGDYGVKYCTCNY